MLTRRWLGSLAVGLDTDGCREPHVEELTHPGHVAVEGAPGATTGHDGTLNLTHG